MSDADTLSEALRQSRTRLFAAINGLAEEQFRYTVDDDDWNIATHLAHLLRCERMLADRSARAINEEEPVVKSLGITNDDDPVLAQRLAVPQIIHGMQASRRDVESLLATASDASLARAIQHERLGRLTAREMTAKMAAHEEEHAATVETLARQARSSRPVTIPLGNR